MKSSAVPWAAAAAAAYRYRFKLVLALLFSYAWSVTRLVIRHGDASAASRRVDWTEDATMLPTKRLISPNDGPFGHNFVAPRGGGTTKNAQKWPHPTLSGSKEHIAAAPPEPPTIIYLEYAWIDMHSEIVYSIVKNLCDPSPTKGAIWQIDNNSPGNVHFYLGPDFKVTDEMKLIWNEFNDTVVAANCGTVLYGTPADPDLTVLTTTYAIPHYTPEFISNYVNNTKYLLICHDDMPAMENADNVYWLTPAHRHHIIPNYFPPSFVSRKIRPSKPVFLVLGKATPRKRNVRSLLPVLEQYTDRDFTIRVMGKFFPPALRQERYRRHVEFVNLTDTYHFMTNLSDVYAILPLVDETNFFTTYESGKKLTSSVMWALGFDLPLVLYRELAYFYDVRGRHRAYMYDEEKIKLAPDETHWMSAVEGARTSFISAFGDCLRDFGRRYSKEESSLMAATMGDIPAMEGSVEDPSQPMGDSDGAANPALLRPYDMDEKEEDVRTILSRHPSRVPGYVAGSNDAYFGYVMRDLASRVLSRHVVGSGADVLVVSPDVPTSEAAGNRQEEAEVEGRDLDSMSADELTRIRSVGRSFVKHSREEGHRVHTLNLSDGADDDLAPRSLDSWWNSFERGGAAAHPSWILLAVFDPPMGSEDAILSGASSTRFLKECTVTYIVFRVHATQRRAGGLGAVQTLIQNGYKVQLLSASHNVEAFPPNSLLDYADAKSLLARGGQVATDAAGDSNDGTFIAFLFATQGLDLAIPSQREHSMEGKIHVDKDGEAIIPYKRCAVNRPNNARVHISFRPDRIPAPQTGSVQKERNADVASFLEYLLVTCNDKTVDPDKVADFWISSATPETSEAACVLLKDCGGQGKDHLAACTSRILRTPDSDRSTSAISKGEQNTAAFSERPNLLVIMIDPISRPLFDQALSRSKSLLERVGFTSFGNYTVVGDNSGPNQAALYSGRLLSGRSDISMQSKDEFRWIWDELNALGYVTYKAEDGCIRNSNMVQSIQPNTTHGSALHEMFCFDFSRPNCVGNKAAAKLLTDHAAQFIREYSDKKPWAAFLSFIDSHEDTNMLAGTLDDPIQSFLTGLIATQKTPMDNTVISVLSDHGLHYGPYMQSRQGKQERARPVLYLKLPKTIGDGSLQALKQNKNMWTTPLDVHATFLHSVLGVEPQPSPLGSSLLTVLPQSRQNCRGNSAIPHRYCDLFDKGETALNGESGEIVSPPSMLSFFADIPLSRKERMNCLEGNPSQATSRLFHQECSCATSHRRWFRCKSHPWMSSSDVAMNRNPEEYFVLIDCPRQTLHMETRVLRDRTLAERYNPSGNYKQPPSILFIEIDSVSIAYADRHFPKTRELLRQHRIQQKANGQYTCASEICAADFSRFTVTGPNSITNLASALSGCVASPKFESCTSVNNGICDDDSKLEFNLRRAKTFRDSTIWCNPDSDISHPERSPWLFDVAKEAGYIRLFAEEFCYDGSPFVAQDNVFPLEPDISVHRVHCRLAERKLMQLNETIHLNKLWKGITDFKAPCVDGLAGGKYKATVPLEHIVQMCESYRDRPRFAFLNAMAAHDYSFDWGKMVRAAEVYDNLLSAFVNNMLTRPDAKQTIIVLRSDHGLQDGPSIIDYSTQIEHSRPWTEIIVPQNLDGLSLEALAKNQDRLASGFDLYRTLRSLMSPASDGTTEPDVFSPSIPDWSINILTTEIPQSRSCLDARVSRDLCRNEMEKASTAPSYATCNKFDNRLAPFCVSDRDRVPAVAEIVKASKVVEAQVRTSNVSSGGPRNLQRRNKLSMAQKWYQKRDKKKAAEKISAVVAGGNGGDLGQTEAKTKDTPRSATLSCSPSEASPRLRSLWHDIDRIVDSYPKARQSGGIFLYRRQQAILSSMVRNLAASVKLEYGRPLRVCETGFGAGHGTGMFLAASDDVVVLTFDRFDRPYQLPIAEMLASKYPNRLLRFAGNSCKTVPKTLSPEWTASRQPREERYQCDVLHGSSLCPSDNLDLVLNSPCGTLLTSTVMDSLEDKAVYFGPNAQWRKLRANGCISNITCFREEEVSVTKNFIFKSGGSKTSRRFCVAIVTGLCSASNGGMHLKNVSEVQIMHPLYGLTKSLNMNDRCTAFQVEVPL